jgi:hypothetical protein
VRQEQQQQQADCVGHSGLLATDMGCFAAHARAETCLVQGNSNSYRAALDFVVACYAMISIGADIC